MLKSLGFYYGNIDGIFGNNTRNAVISFQRAFGFSPDGIVGKNTWNALMPYINGALGFIVSTNISYSSTILNINLNTLQNLYPFISVGSIGRSVLGNNIPFVKIGNGYKEVFYSASYHGNEWITSPVLMKFLADYCYCYKNNLNIFGFPARRLFNSTTIYIVPMVNPDGVDLVTGVIPENTGIYNQFRDISLNFPNIPFPSGWTANFNGVASRTYQSFYKIV